MRKSFRSHLGSLILFAAGAATCQADDQPRTIPGWGEFVDPAVYSTVELEKDKTLVMTSPDYYVDNYGRTKAPRVMQKVAGDFSFEVNVVHVDPAKAGSVLEDVKPFPVAYHSGTLLIRHDDTNFVRFEYVSRCETGEPDTRCDLHVTKDGNRVALEQVSAKTAPTRLKVERKGTTLVASYSQDDGKTWKKFEERDIAFLPDEVTVGISMTSNTKPGCKVKFRDLKLTQAKK